MTIGDLLEDAGYTAKREAKGDGRGGGCFGHCGLVGGAGHRIPVGTMKATSLIAASENASVSGRKPAYV
jgi:hypothetical protein